MLDCSASALLSHAKCLSTQAQRAENYFKKAVFIRKKIQRDPPPALGGSSLIIIVLNNSLHKIEIYIL